MVKELSDKHLAAINRGRKAVGLKAIRMKKKTKEKAKAKKLVAGTDYYTNMKSLLGTETQWDKAKVKYKGDKMALIKYYYSVPFRLRKKYGMPKKAPK